MHMKRRTIVIAVGIIGLLTLLTAGAVAVLVLPSSPDGPDAQGQFETDTAVAYKSSGSITHDGKTFISTEGAVGSNGTVYLQAFWNETNEPELTRELYQENGILYVRLTINNSSVNTTQQRITHSDIVESHQDSYGTVIIDQSETNGTLRTLLRTVAPQKDAAKQIQSNNDLIVENLEFTDYDKVGDQQFKPQNGWYELGRQYRVTNGSGTIQMEPTSNVVMEADVSFRRTYTNSWAGYFFDPGTSVRQEINYEYQPGSVDIETPDWVKEVKNNSD